MKAVVEILFLKAQITLVVCREMLKETEGRQAIYLASY